MSRRLRLMAASAPLFTALAFGCHRPTPPPPNTSPPEVTFAKPLAKKVTQYTDFTGQIQAPETVQLRARVSGYISKVNFTDGDEVKANTVLFEIDPVIYKAQLKQAQGDVENYEAQLKLAEADLKRETDLVRKGSASQLEYDQALAKRDGARGKLLTGQAQLEQAQQNLDWTKVTAPIAGKMDRTYLTAGNVAVGGTTQGTVLTTIVSVDPMYAYFHADEQTVLYFLQLMREGRIAEAADGKGLPIEVRLQNETEFKHKGVLDFVSNKLDPNTGALQIRATLPNPGPNRYLIPGLFVRGRLPAGDPVESILIPDEAVLTDQGNKVVYVVGEGNRVVAKPVTLGPPAEGLRVVARGLSKDDRVIVRGMMRVQPDAVVTPQPGEINPIPAGAVK